MEAWIAELVHPVEAVVIDVVVIDGAVGRRSEADVDTGDADEVLEGGVVGAGAYGSDVAVPEVADSLTCDGLVWRFYQGSCFVESLVKQRRGGCGEVGTSRADVDVEVCYCCFRKPGYVFLDPFCGADEAVLLLSEIRG